MFFFICWHICNSDILFVCFQKIHTFQLVLTADDNNATFAIFLYADVQNAGGAQVSN